MSACSDETMSRATDALSQFQLDGNDYERKESCECRNDCRNLGIFERSVQDPCSDACDDEDEEADISELETDDALYFEDELDPLDEEGEGGAGSQLVDREGSRRRLFTSLARVARKLSSSNAQQVSKCNGCHRPRNARPNSKSYIEQEDAGTSHLSQRCSRTNSFILQLSRQASRQSLPDASDYQIASATGGGGGGNDIRSRSRSSVGGTSGIPTHLYSLERFVSSELDSATESFFNKEQKLEDPLSPSSPRLSSGVSSVSSTTTTLNSGSNATSPCAATHNTPLFLNQRKRKKSFIEISLAGSFS